MPADPGAEAALLMMLPILVLYYGLLLMPSEWKLWLGSFLMMLILSWIAYDDLKKWAKLTPEQKTELRFRRKHHGRGICV